jgi:signal transduction histidine kinase
VRDAGADYHSPGGHRAVELFRGSASLAEELGDRVPEVRVVHGGVEAARDRDRAVEALREAHNDALLEREKAELEREKAERANMAKGKLLDDICHDLRQPLHSLGLFAAALKDRVVDSRESRDGDSIRRRRQKVCCLNFRASIRSTWRRLTRRPSIRLATIRTCSTIAGSHGAVRRRAAGARGGPLAGSGARYLRGRR